ncbi:MAG: hypothetical protein AB7S74_10920 [Hyphomicrobium sp.]
MRTLLIAAFTLVTAAFSASAFAEPSTFTNVDLMSQYYLGH